MNWTTTTSSGLQNVHKRDVNASESRVWELISSLSTTTDQVWPSDRWPPLELSHGIRPGSRGGHGPIRYRVESVEPGRAIRFSFEPPAGIEGWHEFRVSPTDSGARLTHTLVVEHPSIAQSTVVVPLHDALLEDLLDQLEAVIASRPVTRRPHRPAVRARVALVSAMDTPPPPTGSGRRPRTIAAGGVAAVLASIGALHVAWGRGAHWPASSQQSLARHAIGRPGLGDVPGKLACNAVATALGAAAASCLATQSRNDTVRGIGAVSTAGASAVLGLRGVFGMATSGVRREITPEYRRLDLSYYSPLCLALGATMHWLRRGHSRVGANG